MKISIDWLREFIDINDTSENVSDVLTMAGLEVEGIEQFEEIKGGLAGVCIAEVVECAKHPNADKLSVTKVDAGQDELLQVVCGAPNVAAGQKVALATVGTVLYTPEGEDFKIKKGKIRGEVSLGMICAEDELGLGTSHDGIMVLDTDLPNGTPLAELVKPFTDQVLEIGLTPNRADAASHLGVARDLKVLTSQPLKAQDYSIAIPADAKADISIEVGDASACPRYAGIEIDGVKVEESPQWLKSKLASIGLAPINNIVDITNYVLHGLGQPLHAFDKAKITTGKVVVKTLPEGTVFTTLDGVERKLKAHDLMICNGDEPMCIAGVFGGQDSGISDATTSVFLESAYFDPAWVRKTAMVHQLKTDASFRFERGTNPEGVIDGLKYAAKLICEIAGGEIASPITDVYPTPLPPFEVDVRYAQINRLIGIEIPADTVKDILGKLEIEILEETEAGLRLSVPQYRVDVQREADIIEEVLRLYGFNNIPEAPALSTDFLAGFPLTDAHGIRKKVSDVLIGKGFYETVTNSLTKEEYLKFDGLVKEEASIGILNKLSADIGVMRQTMLFSMLEVAAFNINRKSSNLRLFELGKVYRKTDGAYEDATKLALLVSGNQNEESWMSASSKADLHILKTVFADILQVLNATGIDQEVTKEAPGLSYALSLKKDGEDVGVLGLVQPSIAKKLGIKQEVFYGELEWSKLLGQVNDRLVFQPIAKFPEVRRDLSVVVDKGTTFEQILNVAKKMERKLLKTVNVFDVYEGDRLEEGKKSYSVSFFLQDKDKTLNDKVIDKTMAKLIKAFEQELSALIRK